MSWAAGPLLALWVIRAYGASLNRDRRFTRGHFPGNLLVLDLVFR